MGGKKSGENTKKVSGNAKKAEAAAQKQAAEDAEAAAAEAQEWSKGAKGNAKKEAEAEKKAAAAQKKAERDALLAAEEESQRATPKGANAKTAAKKSKGTLDLSQLDATNPPGDTDEPDKPATLNATGIDNALDALSLTTTDPASQKMDRHPERRVAAAYKAYAAWRLPEIKVEYPGLKKHKRDDICWTEFEGSNANPLKQAGVVRWDASKEEVREKREELRQAVEERLGEKSP